MLLNITIASLLMIITTAIHAGGMMFIMTVLHHRRDHFNNRWQRTHIYWVAGTVLVLFFLSFLEVLLWAYTFILVGAIQDIEAAIYFSMVTFTTLGYGDVILEKHWRLLGSFEAANGIIMFGWTTAIVIAVVQRIYFGEKHVSDNFDQKNTR